MTTQTFKADLRVYWKSVHQLADTYPDFSHRFFDRENARHNLEDRNHHTRQDHFDKTQVGGTRGCFQVEMHDKAAEILGTKTYATQDEANRASNIYIGRGYQASEWAVDFFGASISVGLENQIRDLLLENIDHEFVKNDPLFTTWLEMWDCVDISVNNGSVYVKVGDEAERRHRSADGTLMVEAEDVVEFRRYVDSDTGSYIQINVPVGFKGVLTMVGDAATEVIDNNVSGSNYQFTNDKWREFVAKVGPNPYAKLVTSREE